MRVLVLRVLRPLFAPLRHLTWRLAILLASRHVVHGVEMMCIADTHEIGRMTSRLSDALDLIAIHDPRRFARMKRDFRRILLADVGGPEYITSIGACVLSVTFVERASTVELALALVHEAAHARLWRAKVGRSPTQRDRVERACMNAERRFGERLEGADRVTALARVNQDLAGPKWWTREALIERRADELRALGFPRWVIRLSRYLRR